MPETSSAEGAAFSGRRSFWGITDYWLSGEEPVALIVTVEKADALFIDEAHQVVPESGENTRISADRRWRAGVRSVRLS
jgi:hypothetical protein